MAVEFWRDPKTGEPFGVFHIPLRIRWSLCPWGGDRWVAYLKAHEPRPTFRYGKTWVREPRESFLPPGSPDWAVESFDWWVPKDPDGLPPVWKIAWRFKTKKEATDFCIAYRRREAELIAEERAKRDWKEL